MTRAEWVLVLTLAASFYNVGTIWMVQMGYRLWPYLAPSDFGAYHRAWWSQIKPVVFPVAGLALFGSIAMIWLRPDGVTWAPLWLNIALQIGTGCLTAAFWGRWQAQTHYARRMDGSLDPMYVRIMSTHWLRAALITANGLLVFWMTIEHLSNRTHVGVR